MSVHNRRFMAGRAFARFRPVLLLAAALSSTPALAGSQSSPEALKIRVLQLRDGSGVLRVAVQRLTVPGIALPPLAFNPAGCTTTTATFAIVGANTTLLVFDLALGARGRSRTEQQEILDALYGAFASDRLVQMSVRDDLCSPAGTPYVSGVQVQ